MSGESTLVRTGAFAVIRDAMAAMKMIGVSRVVLYRRERAAMLKWPGLCLAGP